jgi:hypothetical protein
MSLPVYSRAHLSRTVALVVALSLTAVSTSALARGFRAADTPGDLNRINVAVDPIGTSVPAMHAPADTAPVSHRRTSAKSYSSVGFEAAMGGIHADAQRDPAASQPIERLRKVE